MYIKVEGHNCVFGSLDNWISEIRTSRALQKTDSGVKVENLPFFHIGFQTFGAAPPALGLSIGIGETTAHSKMVKHTEASTYCISKGVFSGMLLRSRLHQSMVFR